MDELSREARSCMCLANSPIRPLIFRDIQFDLSSCYPLEKFTVISDEDDPDLFLSAPSRKGSGPNGT